jgi:hypothetical protein
MPGTDNSDNHITRDIGDVLRSVSNERSEL